jgi:hypothetical protein
MTGVPPARPSSECLVSIRTQNEQICAAYGSTTQASSRPHVFGVRRVLDKNGEVDPTIFSAPSDVQVAA